MAHLAAEDFLKHYRLISASFDESMIQVLKSVDLPADWKRGRPPSSTKRIGDLWIASNESVVLKVPSVIVAGESNYLINPNHPDFGNVLIGEPEAFRFDRRLM